MKKINLTPTMQLTTLLDQAIGNLFASALPLPEGRP
jgi:hypothetical protein